MLKMWYAGCPGARSISSHFGAIHF